MEAYHSSASPLPTTPDPDVHNASYLRTIRRTSHTTIGMVWWYLPYLLHTIISSNYIPFLIH